MPKNTGRKNAGQKATASPSATNPSGRLAQTIDAAAILDAIKTGRRIDFAKEALKLADVRDVGIIPPFRTPAYKVEAFGFTHQSRCGSLSYRSFEQLSLVARGILMRDQKIVIEADGDETTINQALWKLAPGAQKGAKGPDLPFVAVEDIEQALYAAGQTTGGIRTNVDSCGWPGLQIVGARIGPRDRTGPQDRPLRLPNARFPFSLSFVGCVFEGGLILRDSAWTSIDLSGSALRMLDAGGVQTGGSISLRRATVTTPCCFTGARIGGELDLCDLLAVPLSAYHNEQSLDTDRGMVDLSRAVIDNEVVMNRARIWGGLNFRGGHVKRSLFMDGAILISPTGILAKWACDLDERRRKAEFAANLKKGPFKQASSPPLDLESDIGCAAENLAQRLLHNPDYPLSKLPNSPSSYEDCPADPCPLRPPPSRRPSDDHLAALHFLETAPNIAEWGTEAVRDLLGYSMRTRTHAFRADGLVIEGSLLAEYVYAVGRLRLNHCRIAGDVGLTGSTLYSPDAVRRLIEKVPGKDDRRSDLKKVHDLRRSTGEPFAYLDVVRPQDYAIDLRGSTIGGDLTTRAKDDTDRLLGYVRVACDGIETPTAAQNAEEARRRSDLALGRLQVHCHGGFALKGANIAGSVILRKLHSIWAPAGFDSEARQAHQTGDFQSWPSFTEVKGIAQRHDQQVAPNRKDPRLPAPLRLRHEERGLGAYAIDLSLAVVGDDVDLRNSQGAWGVDLNGSYIHGSVYFSDQSSGRRPDGVDADQWIITSERRARDLRGRVNLRNAKIDGDAILIFSPLVGPEIKANGAKIGGRLDIYPSREVQGANIEPRTRAARSAMGQLGDWLLPSRKARKGSGLQQVQPPSSGASVGFDKEAQFRLFPVTPSRPRQPGADVDEHWHIDLRQARASIFAHAPGSWPEAGYLSIDGFKYDATGGIGPLVALPSLRSKNSDKDRMEEVLLKGAVWLSPFLFVVIAAYLALDLWLVERGVRNYFDYGTLAALATLVAATLIPFVLAATLDPDLRSNRPQALAYLSRQRSEQNLYQRYPSTYVPLDPFETAAAALRSGGRYISANLVEIDRLNRRIDILSWRRHGAAKFLLRLLSAVSDFGFNASRLFAVVAAAIVATTLTVNILAWNGALVPAQKSGSDSTICRPNSNNDGATIGHDAANCPGITYSIDLLSGFMDLGETDQWVPANSDGPLAWLSAAKVRSILGIIQILGGILFLLVGASVLTRFENVLSRGRE